jgi:Mg2+ and Co2+ transporter CorA
MRVLEQIDETLIGELAARNEFFWLDLGSPSPEDVAALAKRFGWHPLR